MGSENPRVALLVIGDEVLRGETQDTNSAFLCRELTARGAEVARIVTVPDDREVIATELRALAGRCDFVLTTGGIGPTPDDMTREAVAEALGQPLLLNQTVVRRYEELRGQPLNEKQLQMCRLPDGAEPILVADTGAPGFRVGNVFVLPGVPAILQQMWPHIAPAFHGIPEHTESFKVAARESDFAALLEQYGLHYPELKFGSYPRLIEGAWEVELRVRGKMRELVQEAARKLAEDISGLGAH